MSGRTVKLRFPCMNLIAIKSLACNLPAQKVQLYTVSLYLAGEFFSRKGGFHGQIPQARHFVVSRFRMQRVRNLLAQHLIAAANAPEGRTARNFFADSIFEAAFPQMEQILCGILGTGQQNQIRLTQVFHALHIIKGNIRLCRQTVKVREVGNLRRLDYGDMQISLRLVLFPCFIVKRDGILIINAHILNMRHNAQHWLTGLLFQKIHGRRQQGHIPAELVDDKSFDQSPLVLIQEFQRSYERSQRSTSVDIGNQEHRRI